MIQNVQISNFKSLKQVELTQCRRINLIIGRPNVGKSNILEALAMFCIPYIKYEKKPSLQTLVRAETVFELFFNGDTETPLNIKAGSNELKANRNQNNGLDIEMSFEEDKPFKMSFNQSLQTTRKSWEEVKSNPFKTYVFPDEFDKVSLLSDSSLLAPNGGNLMSIVSQLPMLKSELTQIFADYGLKYVFDSGSQEIKVMKEKSNGEIFLVPFHSIADTLQRMIFFKAAIMSNHNKTILFEEPEAHTYPPYIANVVQSVIQSDDNQFFITTHSPYIVNGLLEQLQDDLAIYLVDMKDGVTEVKRASDNEMQEMYENGIDLFFNVETYMN